MDEAKLVLEQLKKDSQINIEKITQILASSDASSEKNQNFDSILFFEGKGCNKCGGQGYKGRVGIYEVMDMGDEVKHLVTTQADAQTITAKAIEKGILIEANKKCEKAIKEIKRVCKKKVIISIMKKSKNFDKIKNKLLKEFNFKELDEGKDLILCN